MKLQTVMFCVALTLVLSAQAADNSVPGKLNGILTDSEGAVISKATVLVQRDWPNDNTHDLHLTTNEAGEFSMELTPGFYDVAVFAHAFSPSAGKVRIRSSQVTNYALKLSADPQMIAEFGDRFSENPPTLEPSPSQKR
jgi:hypothetical protein